MKTVFALMICLLVGFNIYFLVNRAQGKKDVSSEINQDLNSNPRDEYFEITNQLYVNNNSKILSDIPLASEECDATQLSDLLKNEKYPKLFFRFKKYDCSTCVQEQLELLSSCSIPKNKIYILASEDRSRDIKVIRKSLIQNDSIELFNVSHPGLQFPLDQHDLPYFFVLDSSFLLKNLFIPSKNDMTLTEDYFSSLEDIFN